MTSSSPVHRAARLVHAAFGASPAVNELLDDLHEQFVHRSEDVGVVAARWSYRWELLRATPYLLRTTIRELSWSDASLLLVRLSAAFALLLTIESIILLNVAHSAEVLGLPRAWQPWNSTSPALPWWAVAAPSLSMLVFGYLAAWLDPDRPLRTVILASVVVAICTLLPLWPFVPSHVMRALLHAAAVFAGGLVRFTSGHRALVTGDR
jgi:hypothetical protein